MAVTYVPGAIDQASQNFVGGMLAGRKLRNMKDQSELLDLRIAEAQKSLDHADTRMALEDAQIRASIGQANEAQMLSRLRRETEEKLTEARKRLANAQASEAETKAGLAQEEGEARIGASRASTRASDVQAVTQEIAALQSTAKMLADPSGEIGLEEVRALASETLPGLMQMMGKDPDPESADGQYWSNYLSQGIMGFSKQFGVMNKLKEREIDALTEYRGVQNESRILRDILYARAQEDRLNPYEDATLELAVANVKSLQDQLTNKKRMAQAARMTDDTERAKAYEADIARLARELVDARREVVGGGSRKKIQPKADENGPTHRPQTEEEYNALPSGSYYIHPDDGKRHRKP